MKQVEYYKNGNRTLRIKYEGIKKLLEKQSKEIERLNNIIKEIRRQLDYLETYSSKEDVFEDMKRRLDKIDKIIGSDEE